MWINCDGMLWARWILQVVTAGCLRRCLGSVCCNIISVVALATEASQANSPEPWMVLRHPSRWVTILSERCEQLAPLNSHHSTFPFTPLLPYLTCSPWLLVILDWPRGLCTSYILRIIRFTLCRVCTRTRTQRVATPEWDGGSNQSSRRTGNRVLWVALLVTGKGPESLR